MTKSITELSHRQTLEKLKRMARRDWGSRFDWVQVLDYHIEKRYALIFCSNYSGVGEYVITRMNYDYTGFGNSKYYMTNHNQYEEDLRLVSRRFLELLER